MTSFDPLTAAFDAGKLLIEKIWPDPVAQSEQLRKLEELHQKGDLAELNAHVTLLMGQVEINKAEAQHKSLFVAGWRPAIGWVGAVSLAMAYIPKAIVMTAMWTYQCYAIIHSTPSADISFLEVPPFPDLGVMDVIGLLGSMLGIAGMRSYDKTKGVATHALGKG